MGGRTAATRDVAVSRAPGAQVEVSIALDPTDSRVLVAGSNDGLRPGGRMRAYGSTDAGTTWRTTLVPLPAGARGCANGDPATGIDRQRRQYFAFLVASPCPGGVKPVRVFAAVASRSAAGARWNTVAPFGLLPDSTPALTIGTTPATADDRPALSVDASPASPSSEPRLPRLDDDPLPWEPVDSPQP